MRYFAVTFLHHERYYLEYDIRYKTSWTYCLFVDIQMYDITIVTSESLYNFQKHWKQL